MARSWRKSSNHRVSGDLETATKHHEYHSGKDSKLHSQAAAHFNASIKAYKDGNEREGHIHFNNGLRAGREANYEKMNKAQNEENMETTNRDIIDHLYDGDLVKMREAFADRMLPYMAEVFENKKLEVAANLVKGEENIQELSNDTLQSYKDKATGDLRAARSRTGQTSYTDPELARKRISGLALASKKLNTEDKDDLQELSSKKLMQYVAKAGRSTKDREKGIDKATKKVVGEDNLQELSGKTLVNYQDKAKERKDQLEKETLYQVDRHSKISKQTDPNAKHDAAYHLRVAVRAAKGYNKRAKGLDLAKKAIARKP